MDDSIIVVNNFILSNHTIQPSELRARSS